MQCLMSLKLTLNNEKADESKTHQNAMLMMVVGGWQKRNKEKEKMMAIMRIQFK